jgi:hypothetical protein
MLGGDVPHSHGYRALTDHRLAVHPPGRGHVLVDARVRLAVCGRIDATDVRSAASGVGA